MKKCLLFAIILVSNFAICQNLNSYKYAIIPEKFTFQKENNDIILNSSVKSALEKYDFKSYLSSEKLPKDASNMNKVFVDIELVNTPSNGKVKIILKDFENKVLFTSKEGKATDKDDIVACNMAFSLAVNSLKQLNHKFDKFSKLVSVEEEVVEPKEDAELSVIKNLNSPISYNAVAYKKGFHLMLNNEIVYDLTKTSRKELFLAKRQDITGIVIRFEDDWYFEYSVDHDIISERIAVNFEDKSQN